MNCLSRICFVSCVIFFFLDASAQQRQFSYINLTKNDGLPSNEVYEVFRDSKNYMWFATDNGVVRYSGTRVETFNLPDNVVFKIREDNKGRIWFFTHTGKLSYYENGSIIPYKYNDSLQKHARMFNIMDAVVKDNGDIWIGAANCNYTISANGNVSMVNAEVSVKENALLDIYASKKNTHTTYKRYNTAANPLIAPLYKDSLLSQTYRLNMKKKDNRNRTGAISLYGYSYLFITDRLFRLNPDGTVIKRQFDSPILCINKIENNLFIGSAQNGYSLLDSNLNIVYTDKNLKRLSISSAATDYEGGIWLSSLEKGVFHLKKISASSYLGATGISAPIFRLHNIDNKQLLFANATGIYLFENLVTQIASQKILQCYELSERGNDFFCGGALPTTPVFKLQKSIKKSKVFNVKFLHCTSEVIVNNDTFILSSGTNIIKVKFKDKYIEDKHFLDQADKISKTSNKLIYNKKTTFLYKDSVGLFWAGTVYGLYKFSTDSIYTYDCSIKIPLLNKGTTCMRQIRQNILAVGIRFGGLALIRNDSLLLRITEREGLLSNKIGYILPQGDDLWVVTNAGISVVSFLSYSPLQYRIKNFGKDWGLHNLIINHIEPYQGNMILATNEGLMVLEKAAQLIRQPDLPLFFNIGNVFSNNKKITVFENKITLKPDSSKVSISLNAICFNTPDDIKYFYRFKDQADSLWIPLDGPELIFEKLSPGTYELETKASLPFQQRESAISTLTIQVHKHWWQNNILRVISLISLLSLAYLVYKWRVTRIKEAASEKINLNKKITELEHIALRSQMNPHFTFNCLSSIQQLIVSGQNELANDYLIKFSRLLRRTLEMSASSFNSISNEIDYLHEYIVLEQLRMPGQFSYEIINEIPAWDSNLTIPVMMIQPLVENSIRHGIKPLTGKKGKLHIHFSKAGNTLLCIITDNGIGRSGIQKTQMWLNIKVMGSISSGKDCLPSVKKKTQKAKAALR